MSRGKQPGRWGIWLPAALPTGQPSHPPAASPPLVLGSGSEGVQGRAAWALGMLAVNEANQAAIAAAGGIPPLVRLLGSGSEDVQEAAAGALGYLADNSDANRAAIAAGGGIPALVQLLGSSSEDVQERAARVLAILARDDSNRAAIAAAGGIPPLVQLLRSGSEGVQEAAAKALLILARNNDANRVIHCSGRRHPPLVQLLGSGSKGVQEGAAWALGTLAGESGWGVWLGILAGNNDANTVAIATTGAIPALERLRRNGRTAVQKRAAWALAKPGADAPAGLAVMARGGGGGCECRRSTWASASMARVSWAAGQQHPYADVTVALPPCATCMCCCLRSPGGRRQHPSHLPC